MSLSGELTTERIGGPGSLMSATDLAHDDEDDDDDDNDDTAKRMIKCQTIRVIE